LIFLYLGLRALLNDTSNEIKDSGAS
jgi:hypothetical protein